MNTTELSGAALNWAVAKAEGFFNIGMASVGRNGVTDVFYFDKWEPSTDWAQGGKIIERERINLHCGDGTWGVKDGVWEAAHPDCLYVQRGNTPLIAAMRCFVAFKLGDEVEIPEGV